MTSFTDAAHQFSSLTTLLDLARLQRLSLESSDLTSFEDLMHQRNEVISQIQQLRPGSESLPDNVIQLRTEFSIGHERDTATASDIVIRMILALDASNEQLLCGRLHLPEKAG